MSNSDGPVQATAKVAEKAIAGLSNSPGMLLIVILNISMIGVCGYALVKIAEMSSQGRTQIMSVLEACIAESGEARRSGPMGH